METDRYPDKRLYGVFDEDEVTGLFVFYIIEDEKYMEMLAGLSRNEKAYDEMFAYLENNCQGYDADFIFNPKNHLMVNQLKERGADFCQEQQYMIYTHVPVKADNDDIEILSDKYLEQYCALHTKDCYWTGDKVARTPDRFRVYLAIRDDEVVGYTDVTYTFEENEPVDVFVKEKYRNQGYGRKLLSRALSDNEPKEMILQVDTDNAPAVHLYESLGFKVKENRNMVTVHWRKI